MSHPFRTRMNVPFVFSTNGHLFVEFDRITGLTSKARPLAKFPTPAELRVRYEASVGFCLEDPAARPLLTRYAGGEATRRYYQDAAIRAVFEKIARCAKTGEPKRALLSLATGSGKTFIAVQILKRIADAGEPQRALFVSATAMNYARRRWERFKTFSAATLQKSTKTPTARTTPATRTCILPPTKRSTSTRSRAPRAFLRPTIR